MEWKSQKLCRRLSEYDSECPSMSIRMDEFINLPLIVPKAPLQSCKHWYHQNSKDELNQYDSQPFIPTTKFASFPSHCFLPLKFLDRETETESCNLKVYRSKTLKPNWKRHGSVESKQKAPCACQSLWYPSARKRRRETTKIWVSQCENACGLLHTCGLLLLSGLSSFYP